MRTRLGTRGLLQEEVQITQGTRSNEVRKRDKRHLPLPKPKLHTFCIPLLTLTLAPTLPPLPPDALISQSLARPATRDPIRPPSSRPDTRIAA